VTTASPPGTFRLLGIPSGAYEIAIALEGFAERRSMLSLRLGENAELPITLALETLRTTITVSGDNALIEPSKTTPSSSDSRHRLATSVSLNLTRSVRLTGVTVAQSALPYTIITGQDNNRDGFANNDRPAGLPRNSAYGTPLFQTDVRLSKAFDFGSRRLDVLVEAFNVLNRANWTCTTANKSPRHLTGQ
jgi:hypothetical protein